MRRLVLDTNIVVSGILWGGRPRLFLTAAENDAADLFTSTPMLDELAMVLIRQKMKGKVAATGRNPDRIINVYAELCTLVTPASLQPIAPDPDDDWVIATAIAAKADLIVTGDKPFLSVGEAAGVRIVTVAQALALLADA